MSVISDALRSHDFPLYYNLCRDKLSSDDYIGTVHLKLSDISQDGEAGK